MNLGITRQRRSKLGQRKSPFKIKHEMAQNENLKSTPQPNSTELEKLKNQKNKNKIHMKYSKTVASSPFLSS